MQKIEGAGGGGKSAGAVGDKEVLTCFLLGGFVNRQLNGTYVASTRWTGVGETMINLQVTVCAKKSLARNDRINECGTHALYWQAWQGCEAFVCVEEWRGGAPDGGTRKR